MLGDEFIYRYYVNLFLYFFISMIPLLQTRTDCRIHTFWRGSRSFEGSMFFYHSQIPVNILKNVYFSTCPPKISLFNVLLFIFVSSSHGFLRFHSTTWSGVHQRTANVSGAIVSTIWPYITNHHSFCNGETQDLAIQPLWSRRQRHGLPIGNAIRTARGWLSWQVSPSVSRSKRRDGTLSDALVYTFEINQLTHPALIKSKMPTRCTYHEDDGILLLIGAILCNFSLCLLVTFPNRTYLIRDSARIYTLEGSEPKLGVYKYSYAWFF